MKPVVSILIPVYGVEKYIEQCMRSLFNNTIIKSCEIIIVDDCSPDYSMKIIDTMLANEFIDFVNIVKIVKHEKNRGLAAARNTALELASADYFICVDSDDWVEPDYLELLYKKAIETQADVVGCDVIREKAKRQYIQEQPIDSDNIKCISDMYLLKTNGWLWLKMIRKQLLIDYNIKWLEGLNLLEDLIVMTKIFYKAQKTAYVNKGLYHYRENPTSYMNTMTTQKKAAELILAIDEIENFFKLNNENVLLQELNFQKIHLKARILLRGTRSVQKKYISLWPETGKNIFLRKYKIIHRMILKDTFYSLGVLKFLTNIKVFIKRIDKQKYLMD